MYFLLQVCSVFESFIDSIYSNCYYSYLHQIRIILQVFVKSDHFLNEFQMFLFVKFSLYELLSPPQFFQEQFYYLCRSVLVL